MTAAPSAFSVVMATCDRPRLLADALATVAAQTRPPLEVCLADDGRVPLDTPPAAGAVPIRVVRCGGGHAGVARNRAAGIARGDWLAFLDDDDRWSPDHLAGLADTLAGGTEIAFRDAAVVRERVGGDGTRHEMARRVIAHDWDPARMRTDDFIAPSALVMTRDLFMRLGGFDEGMRFSEDWDLLLRAARVATPLRVPGVTVEVRMRAHGQLSATPDPGRRVCLDVLAARHGLPPLEIRTFWEVAALLGAADRDA